MNKPNPKVDPYFRKAQKWQKEMETLRDLILTFPLTEELKWGKPFYTHQGANVLVIWGFKSHCALGFCKGALLKDPERVLIKPGENTQAVRKIPFTNLSEVSAMRAVLKAYIREAIEVQKAGLEVNYKRASEFAVPEELTEKLNQHPVLKKAFHALTPGRQKGYLLYFSAPKQSKTRQARIEKYTRQILDGQGFHDQYRSTQK